MVQMGLMDPVPPLSEVSSVVWLEVGLEWELECRGFVERNMV